MRYHGGCRNAAQWVDLRYHSHCLPPRHLRGIPLGVRALLLSTLSKAAYFASRFFLIVCNPRPPCFKQVGTPFRATFRHRCPVQRAIASHSRRLVRPGLNADFIREIFQARLPLAAVLPISGPPSKYQAPALARENATLDLAILDVQLSGR